MSHFDRKLLMHFQLHPPINSLLYTKLAFTRHTTLQKITKKNRTELNGRRKIRHESFICSRITRLIWEKCFDFYYSIRSIFSTILYNIFSKRTKNVEWYKQTKSIIMEYVAEYLSGNSVNPQSNGKKVNRYGSSIDRKTTTTTTTTLRFGGTNEK